MRRPKRIDDSSATRRPRLTTRTTSQASSTQAISAASSVKAEGWVKAANQASRLSMRAGGLKNVRGNLKQQQKQKQQDSRRRRWPFGFPFVDEGLHALLCQSKER